MYLPEPHQVTADLGWIELWCDHCQQNTAHDFMIVTDNEVIQNRAGKYVDSNAVKALRAACVECDGRSRKVLTA